MHGMLDLVLYGLVGLTTRTEEFLSLKLVDAGILFTQWEGVVYDARHIHVT